MPHYFLQGMSNSRSLRRLRRDTLTYFGNISGRLLLVRHLIKSEQCFSLDDTAPSSYRPVSSVGRGGRSQVQTSAGPAVRVFK